MVGRQRAFDTEQALSEALHLFWRKGYKGTSLTELTLAMGINKPSMYAAFGNKEALFIRSLEHYCLVYAKPHLAKLNETDKSPTQRVQAYLISVAQMLCANDNPGGCFISLCTNEAAAQTMPEQAQDKVKSAALHTREYLQQVFSDLVARGELAETQDTAALTHYLLTLIHGFASMAKTGTTLDELTAVIALVRID